MAWQNSQQAGWPVKDPITTQVGAGMTIPMHVIPGSNEGGQGGPASGISGAQSETDGWPTPNPYSPAGLENLMTLDTMFVHQQLEILEVITGWETANKYTVKDARGQVIFQVAEESTFCSRCWCGNIRPFEMKIVNSSMREVITLSRPLRCNSCLCPCSLQEMEVFTSGTKLGTIMQNWNPFRPSFSINDLSGNTVLTIKGPVCIFCPFRDVNFEVLSSDGEHQVGRISKKWSGIVQELFTDADVFGVSFPIDLDVKVKALLLASCLLIDFMYFEDSGNNSGAMTVVG